MPQTTSEPHAVLLIDGECVLCNGFAKFVMKRDPEGRLKFAPLQSATARRLLAERGVENTAIMVFIGNRGCLQIHTGPVKNIKMFGTEWLNVLDDEFNMHLRDTAVASAWVVKKPTTDGDVTSLELFDAKGNNLVIFFGKRKPGEAEDEAWRKIVADLA